MSNPKIWYVIADGGRARIVEKRDAENVFDTVREFVSTDLHRHTRDLGTERPGRTHESANTAHHAQQPREDLHRAEKRSFAHEVAAVLSEAGGHDEFEGLVLVAPAHALGELRGALDPATRSKVMAEVQKDLTKIPAADLAEHLVGPRLA